MNLPYRVVLALAAITLALAGCASNHAFNEANTLLAEGRIEPGLAKLEEAVRLDPRNTEYRIALASRRAGIVNRYLGEAEARPP